MKKHIFPVLALLLFSTVLSAQRDETLIGKTGLKLTGLWGGPNIGMAGFDSDSHGMTGGSFGLEFSKSLLLGFGGLSGTASTMYNGQFRKYEIEYGGFMVGYAYKSYKVVHPRVSFLMGSGNLKIKGEPDDAIFVVQPSAGAEVNLFRWFRMGLEGGYRFVSNTSLPKPSDGEVSAPFAQLSFRFGWSWGRE